MTSLKPFLIATRKSTMALAQTEIVAGLLCEADPDLEVAVAENEPRGDRDQISLLDRHGGKGGAFVAEVRANVVAGRCQVAMHSLKDMPGNEETPDLVIGAYLKRDDPSDCLVVKPGLSMEDLMRDGGAGRSVGTNSVRRAALLRTLFPNIEIAHFRGAADTRIRKLDEGIGQSMPDGSVAEPVDAIILAAAGLARVGASHRISHPFSIDEMLPAVGQGIVAVECAREDWETRAALAQIDDPVSRACALAEREILWVLDGHCNSPIAAHATIDGDVMTLRAAVMSLEGDRIIRHEAAGEASYPRELGRTVGLELISRGAQALVEESRLHV